MNRKIFILLAMLISLGSCNDNYLDITPLDRIVDEQVWKDENLVGLYVNGLYDGVPHGFNTHSWSKLTDEAYGDQTWLTGGWNPDNINSFGEGNNYIDYYKRAYQYIRRCNIFLAEIGKSAVPAANQPALIAQVKFVRAFIYANLLWRYGGMPIVEDIYDLQDRDKIARSTYQQVLDYILKDLNEASAALPDRYAATNANFGRATKHAALALKSRLLLYAASSLINTTNDKAKWQAAADAAKAVINLGVYKLVDRYENTFLSVNDEIIFGRTFNSTNGHLYTFTNTNGVYGGWGGFGGRNCPSQNFINQYEMANGMLPFNADGTVNVASGYDPQNPYVNREPRFYQTIIYNGDTFRPEVRPAAAPKYDVTLGVTGFDASGKPTLTNVNGIDNPKLNGDNSLTSYNWKKFIDRNLPISRSNGGYPQPWIFFRLGEIYLNYAEAAFELGNEAEARTYVNLIRKRAGLPNLPETLSGQELRDRIRHERQIELVGEGHRFFDVRRWKIAPVTESQHIKGVDIYKLPDGSLRYVDKILIERPVWNDKFYWVPIPRSEINKGAGLAQSPLWD